MKISTDLLTSAIRQLGFIKVNDLALRFGVTPSTVRRKLTKLESDGLIVRTHGGVKAVDDDLAVTSFALRVHTNTLEKKLIALKAIKLVHDGDTVFLDASTTTYFMTEYLAELPNVKVITNGIDTLAALAAKGVKAFSTGGEVCDESPSVLVGDFARRTIALSHADVAFFSAKAINENGEVFNTIQSESELCTRFIERADKSVLLCDNTKFNKSSSFKICDVTDLDYIVCDSDVSNIFNCPEEVKLVY